MNEKDATIEAMKIQNFALTVWNRFCNKCRANCLTLLQRGKLTDTSIVATIKTCSRCSKVYSDAIGEKQ
jgi:hypothetical protein